MASGRAVQAIASGPKHGASMTSSRTLAVQREVPHIADRIPVPRTQWPVPSKTAAAQNLGTEYWVLIPVPSVRASAGRATIKDNSQARVDAGRGPRRGSGFGRG